MKLKNIICINDIQNEPNLSLKNIQIRVYQHNMTVKDEGERITN